MCGIAFDSWGTIGADWLARGIRHRGPDEVSVQTFRDLGCLVHLRLSLVGVTSPSAKQPHISNRSETVFNGEVFDYEFLAPRNGKGEISLLSEIEVLSDMVDNDRDLTQLNAYYALLSVRKSEKRVVLARDLFGVCPLFYGLHAGRFMVCSERQPLCSFMPSRKVHEVPAGSTLIFDLKKKNAPKLVSHVEVKPQTSLSIDELSPRVIMDTLQRAVLRTYRHSDGPVGLALSDGLDSRLILNALPVDASLYTFSMTGAVSEELKQRVLGTGHQGQWHIVTPTSLELTQALLSYRKHLGPILGNMNVIAARAFVRHWCIARVANEKVLLCGEGADELFCGYPPHVKHELVPMELARKRLSMLRSMSNMVLYRANVAGLLHSKEYRVPYLDRELTSLVLNSRPQANKQQLRACLPTFNSPKYTEEDKLLTDYVRATLKLMES